MCTLRSHASHFEKITMMISQQETTIEEIAFDNVVGYEWRKTFILDMKLRERKRKHHMDYSQSQIPQVQ